MQRNEPCWLNLHFRSCKLAMFASSSFNGLYWQVREDESKMKLDLELIYSCAIYHSDHG